MRGTILSKREMIPALLIGHEGNISTLDKNIYPILGQPMFTTAIREDKMVIKAVLNYPE